MAILLDRQVTEEAGKFLWECGQKIGVTRYGAWLEGAQGFNVTGRILFATGSSDRIGFQRVISDAEAYPALCIDPKQY